VIGPGSRRAQDRAVRRAAVGCVVLDLHEEAWKDYPLWVTTGDGNDIGRGDSGSSARRT
jgi:hypothetical protein